ncbi:b0+-type amino acid transporter 1 [Gurleya vavrai]
MSQYLNTKRLVILLLCNTIGTGVFFLPKIILANAGSIRVALSCWIFAALISILFGLCYSELGSLYPFEGGDAIYLSKAFGPMAGTLFSIISVVAVLPLGGALMTKNICATFQFDYKIQIVLMILLILFLAVLNYAGNKIVIRMQSILTILKIIVVSFFVLLALLVFTKLINVKNEKPSALSEFNETRESINSNYFLGITIAIYSTLWSYDGWNSGNFIAHIIESPHKTFPVSITLAIIIVSFIYILINLSYFYVLPYETLVDYSSNLINDYFNNLDINEKLANALTMCVNIIPALGTLSGSFLVATAIIDSFWKGKNNEKAMKIISLVCFSILNFVFCLVKQAQVIVEKINFFVFLFYGMSVASIFILRKKDKEVLRSYRVNSAIIAFCVAFAAFIVGFAIVKQFIDVQK